MNHTLVKNGLEIPSIGLGTWDMQGSVCSNIVHEALDIGYRHIDCASMYENESDVGQGIINSGIDREKIFITTKINTISWTPSNRKVSLLKNKNIAKHFEQSLTDLQTEYVDLLLIHWPKFETNLGDMLEIMYRLKEEKKSKRNRSG